MAFESGLSSSAAIAVLSGGLDSSIALAMTLAQSTRVPMALTFNYGQRAAKREIRAAQAISQHFGIQHQTLDLPWISRWNQSGSLINIDSRIPEPSQAELDDLKFCTDSAKAVWVPNRNGVLLEIAAGVAEASDANGIIVGFNKEEAATFPDNSVEYMEAMNHALSFSTANRVRVLSPTAQLNKAQIVKRGRELDFPFSLLWSCYHSFEKMCGRCESCMRLRRALDSEGVRTHAFLAD